MNLLHVHACMPPSITRHIERAANARADELANNALDAAENARG